MTDLSALTADQLAEKVRAADELGITTEGHLALAELEVRASKCDRAMRERDAALHRASASERLADGDNERADRLTAALEAYVAVYPCPGILVEPGMTSGCQGGDDCPTHTALAASEETQRSALEGTTE